MNVEMREPRVCNELNINDADTGKHIECAMDMYMNIIITESKAVQLYPITAPTRMLMPMSAAV
jgi:hypothetical protein